MRKDFARIDRQMPGAVPQIVSMRHEGRECHSRYTGGGRREDARYRNWIRGFARAIGARRVVVAFEPDSLGTLECLARSRRRARLRTLAYGVKVLSQAAQRRRLPGRGRIGLAGRLADGAQAPGDRDPPRARLHAERDPHGLDRQEHPLRRAAVAAGGRQAVHRQHLPQRQRPAATARSGSTGAGTSGGSRTSGATRPTRPSAPGRPPTPGTRSWTPPLGRAAGLLERGLQRRSGAGRDVVARACTHPRPARPLVKLTRESICRLATPRMASTTATERDRAPPDTGHRAGRHRARAHLSESARRRRDREGRPHAR